jgi:hypothetical protein
LRVTAEEAYATVRKFILDERAMREKVFKDPLTRAHKVAQCDRALAALTLIKPPDAKPLPAQPTLFQEPNRD